MKFKSTLIILLIIGNCNSEKNKFCSGYSQMIVTIPILRIRSKPNFSSEKLGTLKELSKFQGCKTEYKEKINHLSNYWYHIKDTNQFVFGAFISKFNTKNYNAEMSYLISDNENKNFKRYYYLLINNKLICKLKVDKFGPLGHEISGSKEYLYLSPGTDSIREYSIYSTKSCKLIASLGGVRYNHDSWKEDILYLEKIDSGLDKGGNNCKFSKYKFTINKLEYISSRKGDCPY